MAEQKGVSSNVVLIILSTTAVYALWIALRVWLMATFSTAPQTVHFLDVVVFVATALAATILIVRLLVPSLVATVGPTQTNALRLLFQLIGLIVILTLSVSLIGSGFISALLGLGFFGIIVGLAAQAVLGNIFSGLMLLASRPFHINDRISLIAWQYGKFAPSLAHGWLEPSYTGVVKAITLTYTKILTDSNALLSVPNGIVTQSVIMNLSQGRAGHVNAQFEVPIHVDPEKLRSKINTQLSNAAEFTGEEEYFEILEMSSSAYLVALSYKTERHNEREMKPHLIRATRLALLELEKDRTV